MLHLCYHQIQTGAAYRQAAADTEGCCSHDCKEALYPALDTILMTECNLTGSYFY
jgi:hypothetical protein